MSETQSTSTCYWRPDEINKETEIQSLLDGRKIRNVMNPGAFGAGA